VESHIKDHPAWFHRFDPVWTPTVLMVDHNAKERWRLEGYLPKNEFQAQLRIALGRYTFVYKKYADAERWYNEVATGFKSTTSAPEALYWRAVSHYKASKDHTVLNAVAEQLAKEHPGSVWQLKSIPWGPK